MPQMVCHWIPENVPKCGCKRIFQGKKSVRLWCENNAFMMRNNAFMMRKQCVYDAKTMRLWALSTIFSHHKRIIIIQNSTKFRMASHCGLSACFAWIPKSSRATHNSRHFCFASCSASQCRSPWTPWHSLPRPLCGRFADAMSFASSYPSQCISHPTHAFSIIILLTLLSQICTSIHPS